MKIHKKQAEHYIWGESCDGWYLERDADRTIIQERMPAGASEVKHVHEKAKQFFFILSGEAKMWIDGKVITLKSQEGCTILPGIPHQIHNESLEDVEFLVISTPSTQGDRTAL
ncbi:mannose-6-phosphate isomerase-like protein (cupin superfamily) [Paenibacillus sp. V4I3]|uniref:cupin domain-containing protein n=1 Tax=unclassified Paenibacillus TaxID=185978 RepID=UPI0027895F04|nr:MULTISPECIES: cupin domain-containing protein [unclassified Paenibacillus]MDQ0872275.1 mannose-6-phosphate isomerase-like protein (cupin superfamily) [Paenibacillus sp. V4I3]MDQ0891841.1 mannose-6-phosphate isomerase-like protein (cupin superfamily) [Paenibacillus sp. V4I9]